MERTAIQELINWKRKKNHKPLIICGARQVGKTWIMKEFARREYKNSVYINFEKDIKFRNLFTDYNIDRIIESISISAGVNIDSDTLLIFDEIQEVDRGLTALKYFYEDAPQYDIVVAGSLLGVAMHSQQSFPVGKVDFMYLYPLSFNEFLVAMGESKIVEIISQKKWQVLDFVSEKLSRLLKLYFYIGGMPEAVSNYIENKDLQNVRDIQHAILDAYERDFSKHAPNDQVPRIRLVWNSIIGQLSKENKKFIYGFVKEGSRAKDFELAIEWLKDAGLIYRINRTKSGLMPLSAYEDFSAFKLFLLDIGLLTAMGKVSAPTILDGDELFNCFKGALTEQYVLQQLASIRECDIYYWSADNSQGELDFLVQYDGKIIPIEVKASENLKSKSLSVFTQKYSLFGRRFSMSGYRKQDWMENIPLWACGLD